MYFCLRPGKQASDLLVEVYDLADAEESTTKLKVKIMLITFFDVRSIVHRELLSQNQVINQQVNKDILLLSERLKRRNLLQGKLWLLHYDNAPAHNILNIRQFLVERNITGQEQPPYSPDLTLCGFFSFLQAQMYHQGDLFWRREGHQKGRNNGDVENPEEFF